MSMDRKEFCEMLVKAREEAGYNKSQLCIESEMLLSQLLRIETAHNNFGLDKSLKYLSGIHKAVGIRKGRKKIVFSDVEQFADWLPSTYQEMGSRNALATKIGSDSNVLSNIEKKNTKVSIDTFLKTVNVLGYTVTIENL